MKLNCWLRGRRHRTFEEYDPPGEPGKRYLFPHYRCVTCGKRAGMVASMAMKPSGRQ